MTIVHKALLVNKIVYCIINGKFRAQLHALVSDNRCVTHYITTLG